MPVQLREVSQLQSRGKHVAISDLHTVYGATLATTRTISRHVGFNAREDEGC